MNRGSRRMNRDSQKGERWFIRTEDKTYRRGAPITARPHTEERHDMRFRIRSRSEGLAFPVDGVDTVHEGPKGFRWADNGWFSDSRTDLEFVFDVMDEHGLDSYSKVFRFFRETDRFGDGFTVLHEGGEAVTAAIVAHAADMRRGRLL